jgi:hypothetical protein
VRKLLRRLKRPAKGREICIVGGTLEPKRESAPTAKTENKYRTVFEVKDNAVS